MANPISLTLLIDKTCKRVIYAESDSDFVDILLSFLTLPLASISRLTKLPFGSIANLWESIQNLSSDCFFNEECRSMLLRPINSPANPFTALPVNAGEEEEDDNNSVHQFRYYYSCSDCCRSLSFYPNIPCKCGQLTDKKVEFAAELCFFIKPSFKFTVSDDLLISQSSTELVIDMFSKMDQKQRSSLESIRVDVTPEKILELLKRLLVSHTPLTDVFLGAHHGSDKLQQPDDENCIELTEKPNSSKKISVKLFMNEKDSSLLFCEAGKEFTELLASFLTYPMGSALSLLKGQSGIRCFDNLYKSIEALKSADCIKNIDMIQILLERNLPQHYNLKDPFIQIHVQYPVDRFYMCDDSDCESNEVTNDPNILCKVCKRETLRKLTIIDPKLSPTGYERRGEYLKSSLYMITDKLGIKQLPSLMGITDVLIQSGVQEITVTNFEIGEDEALYLLLASMTSKTVITDAFMGRDWPTILKDFRSRSTASR